MSARRSSGLPGLPITDCDAGATASGPLEEDSGGFVSCALGVDPRPASDTSSSSAGVGFDLLGGGSCCDASFLFVS